MWTVMTIFIIIIVMIGFGTVIDYYEHELDKEDEEIEQLQKEIEELRNGV